MSKGLKPNSIEVLIKQADTSLIKDLTKLFNRIEKIFIPTGTLVYDSIFERLDALSKQVQRGSCIVDLKEFSKEDVEKTMSKNSELILRKIDWDIFTNDLILAAGNGDPTYQLPLAVIEEIEREKGVHEEKLRKAFSKEKVRQLQVRNNQPIMQGKWRKEPFTARVYEPINSYVVTNSISQAEGNSLLEMLKTPLDGYLGQAYNYDDHGLTEEWMTTFSDRQTNAPSDKDVIRTQLVSLLEIMMVQVQDRVCTEEKVLEREPLVLGKDVKEVPVWGIDCYTRRMVELAIEDGVPGSKKMPLAVKKFIEKYLLPAINQQPVDQAHNMKSALSYLLAKEDVGELEKSFAKATLQAFEQYGIDEFRIHPKGTGVICIRPEGIPAHVLVTQYLGEIYPPYRWCEKLDVVEQAQEKFELKPTLPDFYNILLERPRQDPDGYGLLYVDASQRANIGSSCSHSCDSNCTSAVVARHGQLTIALTTNRHISYGEELTMDYYSITTSDVEWRAAICLCGMKGCRGSFLHYATQDELQQILNQNYGPLWRYASLLRACSAIPVSSEDRSTLVRHGIQKAALGSQPPNWVIKYVAEILRFIEYERKALPCALIRKNEDAANYSYSNADMDARCVMEQRIQSMICCLSMVMRIVCNSEQKSLQHACPLAAHTPVDALAEVFERIRVIPDLLEQHLLKPLIECGDDPKKAKSSDPVDLKIEKTKNVIIEIRPLLTTVPTGFAKLREVCLSVRKLIMEIESYSTSSARLTQLSDILVLWAFTVNYSFAREYERITSDPITVVSRELGNNIPRSKIFAGYRESVRNRSGKATRPSSKSSEDSESTKGETGKSSTVEDEGWADTTVESIDAPSPVAMDVDEPENAVTDTPTAVEISNVGEILDEVLNEVQSVGSLPVDKAEDNELQPKEKVSLKSSNAGKKDMYLSPNEPVFQGSKVFSPLFCFWQLIGWFNAGTDQKIVAPDLFGCTQLPEPSQCFGSSESPYGEKQRETLLQILMDEKLQTMPWPQNLKSSFSNLSTKRKPLYGSPMLDIALGQVDAVLKVLRELKFQNSKNGSDKSNQGKGKKRDGKKMSLQESTQYDNILPPELPTNWVQCELCKKWRRVAWHVDANTLPDLWECSMNTWDIDNANCNAPQDSYDPQKENTFELKSTLSATNDLENSKINDWRDVYCTKNHVYYEAQIRKIKQPKKASDKVKLLFHYKGWSTKFDEWIDYDSERIQPHHLFTNPDAGDPRQQEAWQGLSPIKSVIRTAFVAGTKKRKSEEGSGSKGTVGSGSKRKRQSFKEESEVMMELQEDI